ncbi:MAG: cytochrome c oxidase subunit II [Alphaproteobacteria bacterium]|nr:MAG: cytochrome c oxidase subunit II [Alphaproteobacteria bacterium]
MRRNNRVAAILTGMASIGASGIAHADTIGIAKPYQYGFQPSATEIMEQTEFMHNDFLLPLTIVIFVFVLILLGYTMFRFRESAHPEPRRFTHNAFIEVLWTLVPTVIVAIVAILGVKQLQFQDTPPSEPEITIKAIGHQWYWEYEYVDDDFVFDSLMIEEEDLTEGQPRLLSTDAHIVLPVNTIVRLLVTASPIDVIHAWTIPAFGVKVDAIPGRLNERWFRVMPGFEGRYHGQCSELCGARHSYMPIVVDIVSKEEYQAWLVTAKAEYAGLEAPTATIAALTVSSELSN